MSERRYGWRSLLVDAVLGIAAVILVVAVLVPLVIVLAVLAVAFRYRLWRRRRRQE